MRVLVVLAQPPLPEGGAPARCAVGLLRGLQGHGLDVKALAARQHRGRKRRSPSRPAGRGAEGAARSAGLERARAAAAEAAGLAFPGRVRRARAPACPRRRRAPPGGDGDVLVRSRNRHPGASPRALPDPRGSGVAAPVGPRSAPLRGVRPGRACGDAPPSASRRELAARRAGAPAAGGAGSRARGASLSRPRGLRAGVARGAADGGHHRNRVVAPDAGGRPAPRGARVAARAASRPGRAAPRRRPGHERARGLRRHARRVGAWARYRPPRPSSAVSRRCSTRSSAAAG